MEILPEKFAALEAKAVDLIALDATGELHLVEVKNYTHPDTETIPLDTLPTTIAAKCRDTLGGLAAARLGAENDEKDISIQALKAPAMRVTFHVELPRKRGRLSNSKKLLADLQTKLRIKVKAIDPHARVDSPDKPNQIWNTRRTVENH